MDALADHASLELRKSAGDLKYELAHRRGRINSLLIEIQIDPTSLQGLDGAKQIDERPAQPVYRPCHHNIEAALAGILEHLVKTGTPIATLTARNARVAVLLDNLPAATLSNLAQLPHLIFHRLLVGRDSYVNRCPFCHDALYC